MSADLNRVVVEHLDAQRDEMKRLLEQLVRAESPSGKPATHAEVLRILGDAFDERGFRVRIVPGTVSGGTLIALPQDRPRDRAHQLVIGHCDTVWPVGTLETMPLMVEEGIMRGPGTYDMKAGLVQGLYAISALRAAGCSELDVTPVFLVNSDEETGSRDSTRIIRRLARNADRCFVLEPSLGPAGALKTSRKGVGRFTIRVTGVAAHAGLDPESGASAILELSHVIQKLFALNDHADGVTVNVGTIDGGLQPNVIAPESRAVVDVRVPTNEAADRVTQTIHSLESHTPDTEVHIEGSIGRPPMEHTPGNRQLWRLAQKAAEELGIHIEEASAGGGSDGNTTSQYAPTLDGLGAVGGGAHALDEHLILEKMVERAALLARLLSYPPLTEVAP